MSYREVEVEVMVGDKAEPYTFNVDNKDNSFWEFDNSEISGILENKNYKLFG